MGVGGGDDVGKLKLDEGTTVMLGMAADVGINSSSIFDRSVIINSTLF
jgi:hypothetical protein